MKQKHSETDRESESARHRQSVKEERENTEYTHSHYNTYYLKATPLS